MIWKPCTDLKRNAGPKKIGSLQSPTSPQVRLIQALKLGIELGDTSLCAKAYAEGVSLEAILPDTGGRTAVSYSAHLEKPEIAEFLVTRGVSNIHVRNGFTLFHFATVWRRVELLRVLLEKHPSSLFQDEAFVHPMHVAISECAPECLKLILNHTYPSHFSNLTSLSGRVDRANSTANPTKCKASSSCVVPAIEYLANIPVGDFVRSHRQAEEIFNRSFGESPSSFSSCTPLHLAAWFLDLESTRELLAAGSQVNAVTSWYQTALHIASRQGATDMAELLLEAGAQLQARDTDLMTPPMEAAKAGHLGVLKLLLRRGVDLEACSVDNETILHLAARSGSMESLAYIINRARGVVDLERRCNRGLSVLSWALSEATSGQSFLLNLALCPQAYTLSRSANVLTDALLNSNMTVQHIKMLLKRIPSELLQPILHDRLSPFGTPLYFACTRTSLSMIASVIDLLLKAGAHIDDDGGPYGSPLIAACTIGRLLAVKILIEHGARTTFTKDGKTTDVLEAARHFPEIVHWLLVGRFQEGFLLLT